MISTKQPIKPWTHVAIIVSFAAAVSFTALASTGLSKHHGTAEAQPEHRSVWRGVYTTKQAERGKELYQQECSSCHFDDLLGDGFTPVLVGPPFAFRWKGLSVGDMYATIRETMPQGAPASLTAQIYIDIVAYLLQVNDFPVGATALPTEQVDLESIIIQDEKP